MYIPTGTLKIIAAVIAVIEILLLVLFNFVLHINYSFLAIVFLAVSIVEIILFFYCSDAEKKRRDFDISRVLGNEAKETLEVGQIGIIVYDSQNTVTWISEFLEERHFDLLGQKVTKAIEGIGGLFTGTAASVNLEFEDRIYQFSRSEENPCLFVKDITEFYHIRNAFNKQRVVLGLINFDNYSDTIGHEDEMKIAAINTNIRQKVIDWVSGYNGVIRRVSDERCLVVINQVNFNRMVESRFAILEDVKKQAEALSVDITTSMVFASEFESVDQQNAAVNELMELVLSRGGDQVAVKTNGQDIVYYGTSSEAGEKTSKVRARVMAKSIASIIRDSSNVFVVPHDNADLDAIGGAIGFDLIARSLGRDSYIIANDIAIEPKTQEIFEACSLDLMTEHVFLSEKAALEMMDDNSLTVVVDHHTATLTSAPELTSSCRRVVIIDHHRRRDEANISAMLIYNEPSASSTVELVSELMQYQTEAVEPEELDATVMYAGLLVDTDYLRSRTTSRTFEICAYLKRSGADVTLANYWLKDSLQDFLNKSDITRNMEVVAKSIAVSAADETQRFSRTALAQSANFLNAIKDIDAAFVIGWTDENTVAVSGRSNGRINVQLILEKMGGGGHFNAAGLQRKGTSVAAVRKELLAVIEQYRQEERKNEDNSAE